MGLGDLFKLEKLTLKAFKDIARSEDLIVDGSNELEVMYNPETLATKHTNRFQAEQGTGANTVPAHWLYAGTQELTVKLIFDGTNVSSFGIEQLFGIPTVAQRIEKFLKFCVRVEGSSHEPPYLRLIWGTGVLGKDGFECRADTVDISYQLFDRDGSPLRAEVTAKFVEALDPDKKSAQLRLSSPDLTHQRIVKAGDTLPILCREIYGSAEHYLRVAEVNGLDDFRALEPGQELFFPPFARKRKERS